MNQGVLSKTVGCGVDRSVGGFVLAWFAVPFLLAMVIGLLIEYFISASKCVNGTSFRNVTLGAIAVGLVSGLAAFFFYQSKCKIK